METIVALIFGIITWPVLEYPLHRFIGHNWKLNTLFKKEHTLHHMKPDHFAPPLYKILAAIPVTLVLFALVTLLSGSLKISLGYISGFIVMYTFYEWLHWSFHAKAPKTKLGLKLRKHHLSHHFHNSKMNHGVSTTWFDRLGGTYLEVPVVKVPRNVPFPWLLTADKTAIAGQFSKDYQFK